MRDYRKTEVYKMLHNRLLLVSLITGILCACVSALYMWRLYDSSMGPGGILAWSREQKDFPKENVLEFMTLFSSWMGAEQQSASSRVFYLITPLLSAMPCGWSFWEELNSGYLHMIVTRKDRKSYFCAKIWISFLTGGIVLTLPQVLNLWILSLHIPAIRPNVIYNLYLSSMGHGDLFSNVLYAHPLCYIMLILGIDFVFGGLFALMSVSAAFFAGSQLSATVIPFVILLIADSCKSFLYYISYIEISPLNILHPMSAPNNVQAPAVIIWILILLVSTVPLIVIKGCRLEIL